MAIDKVGQSVTKGFFVPGSRSSSYVASKRNEEGSYDYTSQAQDIGLERQAALQDLGEQYNQVIDNAYTSYLANQKIINASAMGQGYKDAYNQMQNEILSNKINQANLQAKNVRQEIDESALKAREQLDEQFALETTNLDKVGTSLDNYFEYLKNLTNEAGGYFNEENIAGKTAQDIYDQLYNAQPQSFIDEEGNAGKTFFEYVNANIGDKQADTDWRDWLFYKNGWYEYIDALNKSREEKSYFTQQQEALDARRQDAGIDNAEISESSKIDDGRFTTVNDKNYYVNKNSQITGAELNKVYSYFKDINKELKDGAVITVNGKQYIYTTLNGKTAGLYELKERGRDYVGHTTKANRGWFDTTGYTINGKTYDAVSTIDAGSKTSAEISKALNIKSRLDNGELKENDIVKYNGQYYVIAGRQNSFGRDVLYHKIKYQE